MRYACPARSFPYSCAEMHLGRSSVPCIGKAPHLQPKPTRNKRRHDDRQSSVVEHFNSIISTGCLFATSAAVISTRTAKRNLSPPDPHCFGNGNGARYGLYGGCMVPRGCLETIQDEGCGRGYCQLPKIMNSCCFLGCWTTVSSHRKRSS